MPNCVELNDFLPFQERYCRTASARRLHGQTRTRLAGNLSTIALFLIISTSMACLPSYAEGISGAVETDAKSVDFALDVRPILSDKCFHCHGPDESERGADLRFDQTLAEQGRQDVAVAGDREASLMWERINDADSPMPPKSSHKQLTQQEIEVIGRWIDQGAEFAKHWSYTPIRRSEPPIVGEARWSRGPVDQFVYAAMQRQRLQPSPPASPRQLVRRLYLDLIGLPPTAEQVRSFEADPSEAAYLELVEELLASPRFGEHWAVWWLDLVRYADSVGFHGDQPVSVWPYREWVIDAFNKNMPFDEFSRQQIAGDLLAAENEGDDAKRSPLFASAYNRLIPTTSEGGAQAAEYRPIYAAARVANFGEVWLASSTGCAQCHDHKYDPFTAEDFYSLAAVFEDIDHSIIFNEGGNPHWGPYEFLPQSPADEDRIAEVDRRYHEILAKYPQAGEYESKSIGRGRERIPGEVSQQPWTRELQNLWVERDKLANELAYGLVTRALPEPRATRLLPRGNWMDTSGPIMAPRPPEFLGGESAGEFTRLDLADWLFDRDNPLTSRVVVNRIWERFFGRGISRNTLDIGNQGQPPTHPELLDWLAVELMDHNWNLRYCMRQIVTSSAYRQACYGDNDSRQRDPSNRWFSRQLPVRLPAETLRDQALAVSGLLSHELGGPSVYPYQPDGHWDALNFPKREYHESTDDDLYRRSVYTWVQRTFPHPAMTVFDAPNRESCVASRSRSNTPLQALTRLNEPLYVESARSLAENVLEGSSSTQERIVALFQATLQRTPTNTERDRLTRLLDSQLEHFRQRPELAAALCQVGVSSISEELDSAELAAYTSLARVMLNLHETLTRP